MHYYLIIEGGDARWKLLAICRHRGEQSTWKVVGLLRPGSRSEYIPRYTNAPMMVFMPEGTVVATTGVNGSISQEGGGILWAWIEDPKIYPGIPMY